MIRWRAIIDNAPHAELGTQARTLETGSERELAAQILGVAREHPETEITVRITAHSEPDA